MKLGGLLTGGVALLIALTLAAEENGNTSIREAAEAQKLTRMNDQHQNAELKRLTDLVEPESQIEDQEIEPSRRVRARNGAVKRRRRLRKRPRTTTVEPFSDDLYVGPNFEPQFSRSRRPHHEQYGEEHQSVQRRRQGKRRRRPLRRYPDHHRTDYLDERPRLDEIAEIPPRRRRKGGKKRMRIGDAKPPPVVQTDDEAIIPDHDFSREPVHPETSTQETVKSTNAPEQSASEESELISDQNQPTEDIRSTSEYRTESEVVPTTEAYRKFENEDINLSNTEFHHTDAEKEPADQPEDKDNQDNSNLLNSIGTESNLVNYTEEETTTTSMRTETTKGEIIFDRKALFPTSKRLPLTSALIRRRLRPNSKPMEESNDMKDLTRNEIVPGSLMAQGNYTKISTEQLLEQLRAHMSYDNQETTEEPNYPKLLPNINKIDKTSDITLNTDERLRTTESNTQNESTNSDDKEKDLTFTQNGRFGEIKNQKVVKTDKTLKYEALDIPNVKDDILELLKSDSGASRLARILELRNMTLAELIEHRERGSSQLHLSEIFKRSHHTSPNKAEQIEEMLEDNQEYNKQENSSPPKPIEFPNEEIMGSFPKYLQEQISRGGNGTAKTTAGRGSKQNDSRESRAFKSSTEKIKTGAASEGGGEPTTKRIPLYPSWKVIPNPKLKPVSVQGEYEEIYLSKFRGMSRQNSSDETNEVIAFGENDSPLFHKNNIRGQLSAESIKTKIPNQTTFRRIPPGMKSAIIVSGAILVLAIFGFLSVLISCRVRQRRARMRAKQDILCEQLQNEDFMNSQRSLSPVLTKAHREPVFSQGIHSNTTSNRHYYLWRTLRKTFQYD